MKNEIALGTLWNVRGVKWKVVYITKNFNAGKPFLCVSETDVDSSLWFGHKDLKTHWGDEVNYPDAEMKATPTEAVFRVCEKALTHWGYEAQEQMFVEEVGELLASLNHFKRGKTSKSDLRFEIADVWIMLLQVAIHHGYFEVFAAMKLKTEKLLSLMMQEGRDSDE